MFQAPKAMGPSQKFNRATERVPLTDNDNDNAGMSTKKSKTKDTGKATEPDGNIRGTSTRK